MAVLNIEKSFLTENRSVLDFLNQPGKGLYIPLYQRDYSWDSDNIDQLLEDLSRGIQRIALGEVTEDNKEIRFLGTIITVVEPVKTKLYPIEIQAVPPSVEKLIDGQQRLSTISLMATLLTKRLTEIKRKVKLNNPIYNQVVEICDIWIDKKLLPIFSFDLGRGTPRLKPKIIRGAKDYWTREDKVDTAYQSELSNYLGFFIDAYDAKTTFPCLSKEKYGPTNFYYNGKRIESWLKKTVANAHKEQTDDEFPSAENILKFLSEDQLWEYARPELVDIVNAKDFSEKNSNSNILCELVQTLSVCHYLLDRCCFTIIQPIDEDWAFDMFQSLNATGTPLTAIETFKPTVVNTVDNELGHQFKDSNSDCFFKKIESFLSDANTAQQKNKRTNDFLTSFFAAYDGRTMSTHFSFQRKALDNIYDKTLSTYDEKENFIKQMGYYAQFYQYWLAYDGEDNKLFPNIDSVHDADIASMLILFLKSSNHKMAITLLAKAYYDVIDGKTSAESHFVEIVKAVAAYYFLWRSTYPNSGLDTTYRDFFKQKITISVKEIKNYFKAILTKKDIADCESWKSKAKLFLKYDSTGKEIIRLALLAAFHDTIIDDTNNGLIKIGRNGVRTYLSLEKWLSGDMKTIEHIAPQTNKNDMWDIKLYDTQTEAYQLLGNLTLLPQDLNSSAGNKGWKEKLLYYKCVAEKDPTQLDNLVNQSNKLGIELNETTMNLLQNCQYNEHLQSISTLPSDFAWDFDFVNKRTDCLLEIIWKRISQWLE